MSQSNRDHVDRELEKLNRSLRPFIVGQMSRMYGASWQHEAEKSLSQAHYTKERNLNLDEQALLHILRDQWERIFHQRLKPAERRMIYELLEVRNKWAHRRGVITDTDVERLLKNMERLLTWIDSADSFYRSTFTQPGTTHSRPRPETQTPPHWQDLPGSPGPARPSFPHLMDDNIFDLPNSSRPAVTTGKPRLSRRAILIIATGVAVLGVPTLCELTQQGQSTGQIDQTDPTAMTPEATPTAFNTPLFTYTGHSKAVNAVAWSPDGKRIASGSDDTTVQVWNASNGGHIFTYHGNSDGLDAVAWSPDGKRLASGSQDNTVQVWDADNGSHVFTYTGHSNEVDAVAWSPDGKRIASGSEYLIDLGSENLRVWNASDGSQVFANSGEAFAVAWSPDGKRLAAGSVDGVQVWNASDGNLLFTYRGHSDIVLAVMWSPDGKRIASGSQDETVQVWNADDGSNVLAYTGHSDKVTSIAWSLDGKQIASGSQDNTVQVWQAM